MNAVNHVSRDQVVFKNGRFYFKEDEPKTKAKYRNQTVEINGMKFDSLKEAERYAELLLLQKKGEVSELQRQVPFILIPAQKENDKVIERECKYIADFVYNQNGMRIVEDTKGVKTKEYIIKRKLMLYIHNIKIKEV